MFVVDEALLSRWIEGEKEGPLGLGFAASEVGRLEQMRQVRVPCRLGQEDEDRTFSRGYLRLVIQGAVCRSP